MGDSEIEGLRDWGIWKLENSAIEESGERVIRFRSRRDHSTRSRGSSDRDYPRIHRPSEDLPIPGGIAAVGIQGERR